MARGKIAVVNADDADIGLIKESLSGEGYEIIAGDSSTMGISAFEKEKPDLLILGMKPGDHTGNVLLDIMNAKGISVPTLVITTADLITDNLAQKGIAGLLLKPIDKTRLIAHVDAIFDIQRSVSISTDETPVEEPQTAPVQPKETTVPPSAAPEIDKASPTKEPEAHQVEEKPSEPEPSAAPSDKPLVLVVDDEPDMQTLLKDLLDFSGFEVITAGDGVEGMQMAQQRKPQAILLDIMLPKLDGFQVCRLLKFNDKFRDIPIIMLTARNHPKDKELADGSGADGYVVKPFETKELIAEINRVIAAKG